MISALQGMQRSGSTILGCQYFFYFCIVFYFVLFHDYHVQVTILWQDSHNLKGKYDKGCSNGLLLVDIYDYCIWADVNYATCYLRLEGQVGSLRSRRSLVARTWSKKPGGRFIVGGKPASSSYLGYMCSPLFSSLTLQTVIDWHMFAFMTLTALGHFSESLPPLFLENNIAFL